MARAGLARPAPARIGAPARAGLAPRRRRQQQAHRRGHTMSLPGAARRGHPPPVLLPSELSGPLRTRSSSRSDAASTVSFECAPPDGLTIGRLALHRPVAKLSGRRSRLITRGLTKSLSSILLWDRIARCGPLFLLYRSSRRGTTRAHSQDGSSHSTDISPSGPISARLPSAAAANAVVRRGVRPAVVVRPRRNARSARPAACGIDWPVRACRACSDAAIAPGIPSRR